MQRRTNELWSQTKLGHPESLTYLRQLSITARGRLVTGLLDWADFLRNSLSRKNWSSWTGVLVLVLNWVYLCVECSVKYRENSSVFVTLRCTVSSRSGFCVWRWMKCLCCNDVCVLLACRQPTLRMCMLLFIPSALSDINWRHSCLHHNCWLGALAALHNLSLYKCT